MTTKQTCLSSDALAQLAQGEFLSAELCDIEAHVAECDRCRRSIQLAETDAVWAERILPVLKAGVETTPAADQADDCAASEAILGLLGPTDDPTMLGRIGPYEVAGIVGRGGMGIVFKAFDAPLDRFVAIKMLLPHLAESGGARRRFSREAQAAAAVVDDHVLPIYGVDEWEGIPYMVTQYSRGMTLQKRIHEQGPLDLKEILRVGLQTARGLAAAHAQGLVHRDVKPSNILLDGTVERALLTDFGLARAADDASMTRSGMVAGTPQYMSPEQVRGDLIDARSDLFSLGSTMYAMCAGRSPFRSGSAYSVMHRITEGHPSPIQEINPEIPEWLCDIIKKLMLGRPGSRFATAAEVADLLEDCLAHVQQPTTAPLPKRCSRLRQEFSSLEKEQQPRREKRSFARRCLLWLVLGLAFLLAGVLVVFETSKGKLTIESEADGVPIRVMQRGKLVKRLTVNKTGAGIRVAAGQYVIEIEGDIDGLRIKKGNAVTLARRGKEVVKIVYDTRPATGSTRSDVSQPPEEEPSSGGRRPDEERRVIPGTIPPDDEIERLAWGKPVRGLRVALRLVPERKTYAYGSVAILRYHVQNVSKAPVHFYGMRVRQSDRCIIKVEDGQQAAVHRVRTSIRPVPVRYELKPNQQVILDGGELAFDRPETQKDVGRFTLRCQPGTLQLSFRVALKAVNREFSWDDDGSSDLALNTGETAVSIQAAGPGVQPNSNSPRTSIGADRDGKVPSASVLLTILKEYDRTMESGFTVEGTKIDVPGLLAGGNLPPTRRSWKLSMSPTKFGYDATVREVLSWRDLVGPSGDIPARPQKTDHWFSVRSQIFLNKKTLAEYSYFAAKPIFTPGPIQPSTDDHPGLAVRGSLTTHPAREANRYGFKNNPLWAMGRSYSPFITRIHSIKQQANGHLVVVASGKRNQPARWELVIDPKAGYLVRKARYIWSDQDPPGFVITTSGTQWVGNVSIPKSYKRLEDTGYSDVVNSKLGGTFTKGTPSADLEFLKSMELILKPPYPVPTTVVKD